MLFETASRDDSITSVPTLPTGGGAIRGIGESFKANPATGTASFSVPLPFSSARALSPSHALSYDSGSGNGPYGIGWSVGLPQITRKTDKGLPTYHDLADAFSFNGAELLPKLEGSAPIERTAEEEGRAYLVRQYIPRTEGAFDRIELWRDRSDSTSHWRVWSAADTLTIYGQSDAARLSDPGDPSRIFSWAIERVCDGAGNLVLYTYRREDDAGIQSGHPSEGPRLGRGQAQLYPHHIYYGNRTPFAGVLPEEGDFCFRTSFDYGETDKLTGRGTLRDWALRDDPFSRHKAGFDIRTRRLCTRVVCEHLFPELGPAWECVKALEFSYGSGAGGQARLEQIDLAGFTRSDQSSPYVVETLPPLRFGYTEPVLETGIQTLRDSGGDALRVETTGKERWVDLYGTALPGLLSEAGGSLSFRENLGQGVLGAARSLPVQPSLSGLDETLQIEDRLGRGRRQMLATGAGLAGFYEAGLPEDVTPYHAIDSVMTLPARDADLRAVDLTGDGLSDRLRTDGQSLVWYRADADGGFDEAQRVALPVDGQGEAAFVFSDKTGLTYLADMCGDGLLDVVHISVHGVRYWPNQGFGRFGRAVDMTTPPHLRTMGTLTPDRLRLVDLDGNGLSDILWLGAGDVTIWANLSGNGFAPPQTLAGVLPNTQPANEVAVTDILGQGTACLSWAGRQAGVASGERRYVDLYAGVKGDLLARVENGFGGLTELSYLPSTHYAREAAQAGQPWVTRLHFPVHCLASSRVSDQVTGYSMGSSYSYHHGFYDPMDREFRGFARVDQYDSESLTETGEAETPRAFFQPTALTRSWFHTGARLGSRALQDALADEFYRSEDLPLDGLAPELPEGLSDSEWSQAQRALRGGLLRSETYTLDESAEAAHPYTIGFGQVHLRRVQPEATLQARPVPPVFQVLERQSVSIVLDRNPSDPRVSQSFTLDWNDFGMPLASLSLAHGRWGAADADAPDGVEALQRQPVASLSDVQRTGAQLADTAPAPGFLLGQPRWCRLPQSYASTAYELRGLTLPLRRLAVLTEVLAQIDSLPALPFTDQSSTQGRRRIAATRSYFVSEDLTAARPLGEVGRLPIVHHSETLAFTQDCLADLYADHIGPPDLLAAGYVEDADEAGAWWAPSGTALYGDAPEARFYIPVGARDPFGNETYASFDDHLLTLTESRDPLGNTARIVTDYRHLAPVLSRDANDNWTATSLSALGQPLALAAMGKVEGVETPSGNEPCEGSTLSRPSAELSYDLFAWDEGRGPVRVSRKVFEDHGSAGTGPRKSLMSHDYTDGLGNLVMSKAQAAPGLALQPLPGGGAEEVDTAMHSPPALRWLGNGRTILNNKGQPVRQYEPYFSTMPGYEDDAALVEQGISLLPFYDAAGREIGQLAPDGSWSKTRHSPWRVETWDAADTCLSDPLDDPELGGHFAGLPPELYGESWHARRVDDRRGAEAARAAEATGEHAATPSIAHLDATGQAVVSLADNGEFGTITSRTELDIEGNALSVTDDGGRVVMRYLYNLLPPDQETPKPALWQASMDQGEARSFADCMGRAALAWDAMGTRMRTVYDAASRPLELWQRPEGASEKRILLTIYGEAVPDAEARNLRGQAWQVYDAGGWMETTELDFLGNVLRGAQRLLAGEADAPHWPDADAARDAMLEAETFRTEAALDALSRPVRSVRPYSGAVPGNIEYPTYDEGGGLASVEAEIAGGPRRRYVEQITYDAKGQRQLLRLGNGVETRYEYDPETYRLTRLISDAADGTRLQDLEYTYDILGNVVAIRDATQPVIHHDNAQIEPVARYTYDAVSRLIEATGREHIQQTSAPDWQSGQDATGQINDMQQMRHYTQLYAYDSTGNILSMRHVAQGAGWTRHYGYDPASNRLLWTNIGREDEMGGDRYDYNAAGAMLSLPHLGAFRLNTAQQMVEADLGGGGRAVYTYSGDGARVRKRVERTGDTVEERLYLGSLEIFRKWVDGTLRLRRETMHVGDDTRVIALVETQTHDETGEIASPERLERYQLGNLLGSVTLEVDGAGAVLTREEYHPYGTSAFYASAPGRALPPKRYRFTGQERDDETGLQYHGARYYAPWLARWTAADPIGIGDGLNVYAYVGGRPVASVDPTGTQDVEIDEPFIPTVRATTEQEMIWDRYFYRFAGALSPTQQAELKGEFIWPETRAATAQWNSEREKFARLNKQELADAAKRDDERLRAELLRQYELGLINDQRDLIPISGLSEDELTDVIETFGVGPYMLFIGGVAHGASPPITQVGTSPAQIFSPGSVTVVDFSGQNRVPPNARILAQIVQQAMNDFSSSPNSVQHYLSPNQIRSYEGNPSGMGGLWTGRAVENYSSSYISSVPSLSRRISIEGGAYRPDNIIGMESRPSEAYGFTDTHPRNTEWGRVHELRVYLQEGRTGIPAFGIQYEPFPEAFHFEATRTRPPNYTPLYESQIRRAPLVRPSRTRTGR